MKLCLVEGKRAAYSWGWGVKEKERRSMISAPGYLSVWLKLHVAAKGLTQPEHYLQLSLHVIQSGGLVIWKSIQNPKGAANVNRGEEQKQRGMRIKKKSEAKRNRAEEESVHLDWVMKWDSSVYLKQTDNVLTTSWLAGFEVLQKPLLFFSLDHRL